MIVVEIINQSSSSSLSYEYQWNKKILFHTYSMSKILSKHIVFFKQQPTTTITNRRFVNHDNDENKWWWCDRNMDAISWSFNVLIWWEYMSDDICYIIISQWSWWCWSWTVIIVVVAVNKIILWIIYNNHYNNKFLLTNEIYKHYFVYSIFTRRYIVGAIIVQDQSIVNKSILDDIYLGKLVYHTFRSIHSYSIIQACKTNNIRKTIIQQLLIHEDKTWWRIFSLSNNNNDDWWYEQ